MPNIKITVAEKIATNTTPGEVIVCGNSDYTVTFDLDAEWAADPARTARFVYYKNGRRLFEDVTFTGDTAAVPVLSGIDFVEIGVYAGNLHTTTPARVLCDRSILCGTSEQAPLVPSQYDEIMELLAGGVGMGAAEKKAILFLFKNAGYKTNSPEVNEKVNELEALWSVSYKVSYSLTGATASNNASAVVENGAYTSTLTAEGGYTLTGATVKITMGGEDITSTAYSNGVINIASVTGNVVITVAAKEIPSFTITNNLTNVTNSNSATKVAEGDFYTATLSCADGYDLATIVITMGGVDVTADVYGEGNILITEVTGDVVITAVAEKPQEIELLSGGSSSRTFYAGADDTSGTVGSHGNGGNIPQYFSKRQTESNAAVSVTFTNSTDADITCDCYIGGILGDDNLLIGSGYAGYHTYHTIKAFSGVLIGAGESVTKKYTLPAGYYLFAYASENGIVATATGNMDIADMVNEVAFTGTTSAGGRAVNITDAFAKDTTIIVRLLNSTDATVKPSNVYYGFVIDGDTTYHNSTKISGLNLLPGVVSAKIGTLTVQAGYRFATTLPTEYVYIEKIS